LWPDGTIWRWQQFVHPRAFLAPSPGALIGPRFERSRGAFFEPSAQEYGMDYRITALERAFQLARAGRIQAIGGIKAQLRREGYDDAAVEGPLLRSQLKKLMETARSGR
jgi:hypothetical protein